MIDASILWPGVERIVAPNPGPKTLDGTNLYVVGSGPAYLIDAGPDDSSFVSDLAEHLSGRVSAILLTHGHPDHAGGAAELAQRLEVPVWVSPEFDEALRRAMPTAHTIVPDTLFPCGEHTLQPLFMPGHSKDHLCFLLEREGVLFSGDNILGRGTTLIARPEGNMTEYMATLDRILSLTLSAIAPGHGPVVDHPKAKVAEYIEHRRQREREVISVLQTPATAEELVDIIYKPTEPAIRSLAILSVEAILEKLEAENRVELIDDRYRLTAVSYPVSPGIKNTRSPF